jgi:hypothetical protein
VAVKRAKVKLPIGVNHLFTTIGARSLIDAVGTGRWVLGQKLN